jgi:hypothetical protein
MAIAIRRGHPRGAQRGPAGHSAVTVDTTDFDSIGILPMQLATTMAILFDVAIDTVHAFFEVDIL